jgi:two-component sensor histidine kinase
MIGHTDYDILSYEDADTLMKIKRHVLESGIAVHLEIPLPNASGEMNYFAGSYVPKRNVSGGIDGLIGYFTNVTETKQANEKIVTALAEKEILIREIHHRVKNNLQIISGLLDMTRMRTQDPETTGILTDMMMRIKTMAQIHTRLYQSKQFDKIDMSDHIRDQMADLSSIYGRSGPEITYTVEAEDLFLPVDQAIPCALVVNEVVSNAFKHAFRGRRQGTLVVSAHQEGGNVQIRIEDNGIGIPKDVDSYYATSLGLKLIRNLVGQLQGTLAIESSGRGTGITIDFPLKTVG